MAFSQVQGTATTNLGAATTHAVNLPAGIQANEGLLIIVGGAWAGTTPRTISTPSGWEERVTQTRTNTNFWRMSAFVKRATGSEGSTVNVTFSASSTGKAVSYRISGVATGNILDVVAGAGAAVSGAPNPPNLSPSWGSADTLWIAAGRRSDGGSWTAAPTNYTNLVQADGLLAAAQRELAASSEDPGVFSSSGTPADGIGLTLAFQPVTIEGTGATSALVDVAATGVLGYSASATFEAEVEVSASGFATLGASLTVLASVQAAGASGRLDLATIGVLASPVASGMPTADGDSHLEIEITLQAFGINPGGLPEVRAPRSTGQISVVFYD